MAQHMGTLCPLLLLGARAEAGQEEPLEDILRRSGIWVMTARRGIRVRASRIRVSNQARDPGVCK